jgi:hypothetical protein
MDWLEKHIAKAPASQEQVVALFAEVRKIRQQVIGGQPQDAGQASPESKAQEIKHPKAGRSGNLIFVPGKGLVVHRHYSVR